MVVCVLRGAGYEAMVAPEDGLCFEGRGYEALVAPEDGKFFEGGGGI